MTSTCQDGSTPPCTPDNPIVPTAIGPGDDGSSTPSVTASDFQVLVNGEMMNLSDAITQGLPIPNPLGGIPSTPGDDGLSGYRLCWGGTMLSYFGINPELWYALGGGSAATLYAAGTTTVAATSTPGLLGSLGTGLAGVFTVGVTAHTMGAQAAMACSDTTGYVPWILQGRPPNHPQPRDPRGPVIRPRNPGQGPTNGIFFRRVRLLGAGLPN